MADKHALGPAVAVGVCAAAARDYIRRGMRVVPIVLGRKDPNIHGWPSLQIEEKNVDQFFAEPSNIGIILGEASSGVIDIDLDCPEAARLAPQFLPATRMVHGRPSKPSSHWWYRATPAPGAEKLCDINGKTIVELRSNGQQTLVAPSVHPNGELIVWEREGEPLAVDPFELERAVRKLAAAALLVRHYPAPGSRHDFSLHLAGSILRWGLSEDEAVRFVEDVTWAGSDEESGQRVRNVITTAKRLAQGLPVTGAPTLAAMLGGDVGVVHLLRNWISPNRQHRTAGDTWPDPAPLGDELLSVPAFDLKFLPPSFCPLVEDVSERMQTPLDYAAAAVIVALAGCVNRRAAIRPKQDDQSWVVVPNLWGAVVAPPGMMKSPVLHTVTLPLAHIEEKWRAEYEGALSDFDTKKKEAELSYQAWCEQFKQAIKKGAPRPVQPDKTLRAPTHRRLVTTDATFEKLHEILAQNPAGILIIRDELTGWLSELDRFGREGERAFFLQAWNGDTPFTMDRIGRGSIHVPAVCISLLGNIQPARLRHYLSEVLVGGPSDDGLFQRFQILVWPDPPHEWQLVDRPANQSGLQQVEKVFAVLAELSADDPVRLRFSPDAQQLFFAWWTELERKIRSDSGLAPVLVAHLAKYRSLMPSLAGLFELADRAAAGENLEGEILISLDQARRAAALCDFLEGHARRVYGCVISPETRSARELARHIQTGDLPSTFTTRNVYFKGWSGLDTAERVRGALQLLEEAGWVCQAESPPCPGRGRPSEVWLVNPKVRHAK